MNTETLETKTASRGSVMDYFNGFRAAVNSPFNEWVTGISVGHSPTWEEKLMHFIMYGGQAEYRKHYLEEHPGVLGLLT
jgi:hypothetical protein